MSRSFTIESIKKRDNTRVNYTGGRFLSEDPMSAAKKMFTKAYHHLNKNTPLSLVITLRETTQGSNHKIYKYRVTKVKEVKEVKRGKEIIVYNFKTKATSLK